MSHAVGPELTPCPRLVLTTLGRAQISCAHPGEEPRVALGPSKTLAVIAYLACAPGRSASREHLIDVFWADQEPHRARHSLRQAMWSIRHALGDAALATRDDDLILTAPVECDRDTFLAALERGDLESAVSCYAGDFLPDLVVPGGVRFEKWADLERARLKSMFLRAAETLARRNLATSRVRAAQQLARRIRDADPHGESGWRLLLEALVAGHDPITAAMEADQLEEMLAREGREPERTTRAALRLARQLPASEPEPGSRPSLVAELIGREREFAMIVGAWEEVRRGRARHIAVTAPAGLGKTRLLRDVHWRLRATGGRAVFLRASPGERLIAYSLASDLAQALGILPGAAGIATGAAATLVALNPSLSSSFAVAPDTATGEEALRRRTIALAETVAVVTEEAPLTLLVDDVHWLDRASRAALLGMLGRVAGSPILVVTTARAGREQALEVEWTTPIMLEPLSLPQVKSLVASLGALPEAAWSERFNVALHASTGGSPLLVLETLQLAMERGTLSLGPDGWACRDPEALQAELEAGGALRNRLEQLDREQGWLLLLLAVLGTPASLADIARTAQRHEAACGDVLEQLEQRGLVSATAGDWEPAHEEIAALAVETATPEALRAAHAAVGGMLLEEGERDPHNLLRAGPHLAAAGDDQRLASLLMRWLKQARRHGDRRPLGALAHELLGEAATPERVGRLLASVPRYVRLGLSSWRGIAAAAAIAITATVGAAVALSRPVSTPADALLLVLHQVRPDSIGIVTVPIHGERWDDARSLDAASQARPARLPAGLSPSQHWSVRPGGGTWAFTRQTPDSGGEEVFVGDSVGEARRLTYARGADDYPTWAPDGRRLVFRTTRWSSEGWHDIAVLDVTTGEVKRLTRGAWYAETPYWSPDGIRIAFLRWAYDARRPQLCWTTLDAGAERCFAPGAYTLAHLKGWYDPEEVLAVADSAGEQVLARVHLGTREIRVMDREVLDITVSPDGRWVACLCRRGSNASPAWLVYPLDRPHRARRVALGPEGAGGISLAWGATPYAPAYLDRVEIVAPEGGLPLDATHRLRVSGTDARGEPIALHTLTWRSGDTAIATVDSAGTLRPRRPGPVTLDVSAGGWRRASVTITVVRLGFRTLLMENWRSEPRARWVPFGRLDPVVGIGPGGVPSLRMRGDSTSRGGVYSGETFAAARGLGVEIRLAKPPEGARWRGQTVSLGSWLDSTEPSAPKARAGGPSGAGETVLRSCGFRFPAGELPAPERFTMWSGRSSQAAPLKTRVGRGDWYTLRIQIFRDGRCGIALDGRPLWRPQSTLPLDRPFHLILEGGESDAPTVVGPVEIWLGVRGGVDWSVLDDL